MGTDHSHGIGVLEDLRAPSKALRTAIPDVYAGFAETHRAALEGGVVDAATKELVALAISVAQQCDGCIASHARGAAMKGATPEQVSRSSCRAGRPPSTGRARSTPFSSSARSTPATDRLSRGGQPPRG
jgi:AhpD family alkylhydroperoxidase